MKEEYEVTISLWEILYILKKRAVAIIAIAVFVSACFGCGAIFLVDDTYTCQADLYIPYVNQKDKAGDNQVQDYMYIMKSRDNMKATSELLEGKISPEAITASTSVDNVVNTRVINIIVTYSNPREAEMIANALLQTTKIRISKQLGAKQPVIIQKANNASFTKSNNIKRKIVIGFALGFIISCLIIIVRYSYKTQIATRAKEDFAKAKKYLD